MLLAIVFPTVHLDLEQTHSPCRKWRPRPTKVRTTKTSAGV